MFWQIYTWLKELFLLLACEGMTFFHDLHSILLKNVFFQIRVDEKMQTKRFNSIRKVLCNDVLVFNFPFSGGWNKLDMDLNIFI